MKRFAALLLLAGCSTAAPAPEAGPAAAKPESPVVVEAESPEWKKIAEELAKGRTVGEQQQMAESERRYGLALAWFNKGDFDKAKIEAQAAVAAWPEHLAARKLLSDVNEIIIGGPARIPSIGESDLRVALV